MHVSTETRKKFPVPSGWRNDDKLVWSSTDKVGSRFRGEEKLHATR